MRVPGDMPPRPGRGRPGRGGPRRVGAGGSRLRVVAVVAVFVLLLGLTSLRGIAGFYTDLLWFDSLGYADVFTGVLQAKIVLTLLFTAAFFAVLWLNLFIADRLAPKLRPAGPEEEVIARYQELVGNRSGLVRLGISLVFALLAGLGAGGQWRNWLLFRNGGDFGVDDGQFGTDVGFFVFKLPFLTYLVDWGFASLTVIVLVTGVAHYVNGGIRAQGATRGVTPQVKAHLSLLLALLAGIRVAGYWLARYELDFSERGAVRGATYTDVKAQLPALQLLMVIAGFAVVLFIVNIWRRGWVLPVLAVGLWGLVSVAVGTIYPAFVQRFQVEPSESSKERPYISRNIEATRQALNLTEVETKPFAADGELTAAELQANATTIRNIRLWDPNRLVDSFKRLQERQDYYEIADVDVDRYLVDGQPTQVMLSVRNLETDEVPQSSWEARHLTYTHGYGAVAVPSNSKDENGAPEFLLGDIPARSETPSLQLERPQVYIGEGLGGYVVVDTNREELDYQSEEGGRVAIEYDGRDGVGIGNYVRRAAFALRFGDINPLISGNIRSDSRILIKRNARDRVAELAPFLSFDSDPYPVILDGRIKWVIDAYTTTSKYPYAAMANTSTLRGGSGLQHSFNYVRNSVKAVVDAYDGDVTFYALDDEDPLLRAYRKAFPDLFTDGDEVSDELRAHFRYAEDLFRVQTSMWARYHISDPDDFYNQVDAWNVAQDPGTGSSASVARALDPQGRPVTPREASIEPYYLLMRLPEEQREDFLLFLPFVPLSGDDSRKELTAFMVAKSDPENYGQLQVFTMPSSDPPDGPAIVAADMVSEPEVSELQTLLGQEGSDLVYGNLITVPIEQSLLYVRPIYVQAESTRVPQLERVVVAFQGRVVVQETLREALEVLFPGAVLDTGEADVPAEGTPEEGQPEGGEPGDDDGDDADVDELLDRAAAAFEEAQEALEGGDLGTYQEKVEEGREHLEQARRRRDGATTTTTEPSST